MAFYLHGKFTGTTLKYSQSTKNKELQGRVAATRHVTNALLWTGCFDGSDR